MRTTLTLDPDVVDQLEREQARTRASFKETVNRAIRLGLSVGRKAERRAEPFEVTVFSCGFRAGVDPYRLNQLVDDLEVERFIEGTQRPSRTGASSPTRAEGQE